MALKDEIRMSLATSLDGESTISLTPEAIFGRHCAVLGSSGAGKSWTMARIMEETTQFHSKVLLIDATGEYESLSKNTFHIHIGEALRDDVNSLPATAPYFELTEADLMSIFEPSDGIQWVKLRSAIRTLKLLHLVPALGSGGTFSKANKLKSPFEIELLERKTQLDRPESIFNIHHLPLQIELECVEPVRSQTESQFWGPINRSELTACVPMINRIEELLRMGELQGIFNPRPGRSVFEALDRFLTDTSVSVLRVSLEFLPTTYRAREIISNALARHLLNIARLGGLRGAPVVMVLDEAHQLLQFYSAERQQEVTTDAFGIIAREGRKYGLTLCVATQRPRDIPEDILSQVGTFVVHRLIGTSDRAAIENASGALNDYTMSTLATLGPGEALLLGAGRAEAVHLKMLAPSQAPRSHGPDYQHSWTRRSE